MDTKTHGRSSIRKQVTARCACASLHAHGFRATFGTHGKFEFCFWEPAKFFSRLSPPNTFHLQLGDSSLHVKPVDTEGRLYHSALARDMQANVAAAGFVICACHAPSVHIL